MEINLRYFDPSYTRVVSAPGDNVLAEFASVVDAVQGAVEIQQVLRAKNALRAETCRIHFGFLP